MPALLWPGGDDHRGRGVAIGVIGQSEDLAAGKAMACPQRRGLGTEQGVNEVLSVLIGGVVGR